MELKKQDQYALWEAATRLQPHFYSLGKILNQMIFYDLTPDPKCFGLYDLDQCARGHLDFINTKAILSHLALCDYCSFTYMYFKEVVESRIKAGLDDEEAADLLDRYGIWNSFCLNMILQAHNGLKQ